MKLGLINSTFAQAGKGTVFGIEQTKRIGFDAIDIFVDPLDMSVEERRLIKSTTDRCDLPIKSLCCVAIGLIDFNLSVQRFHLERCRAYLDLAAELGCDNLLLVIGEYIWQRQVIQPAEQWKTAVQHVRTLGKYARELRLEIAIELEPFQLSLINTVDTMLRFLDEVDLPDTVRANCDISHLYLMGVMPPEVRRLNGRIAHVHLSDCDGKLHGDLPPGRGVVPIQSYLEQLRDVGFAGTVSVELEYPPQPDKVVEWVTEAYEQSNKLMNAVGCRGR
jgi:sugar phosphate isomerase/epimerase